MGPAAQHTRPAQRHVGGRGADSGRQLRGPGQLGSRVPGCGHTESVGAACETGCAPRPTAWLLPGSCQELQSHRCSRPGLQPERGGQPGRGSRGLAPGRSDGALGRGGGEGPIGRGFPKPEVSVSSPPGPPQGPAQVRMPRLPHP